MHITAHPSPNFSDRRDGLKPELVVLHFTAMASCREAMERLCTPEHEVSAHYLISRHGEVFSLVDEAKRAWHAGAGNWSGAGDVNSRSIGIELDNVGSTPFASAQMDALEGLLPGILTRWEIPPAGVIAHSDMAPLRKADPGRRFDWRRLALSGLSVWPEPVADVAPDCGLFLAGAAVFGYDAELGFAAIHAAFRQRFRPHATGPLDATDMAMMESLTLDRPPAGT